MWYHIKRNLLFRVRRERGGTMLNKLRWKFTAILTVLLGLALGAALLVQTASNIGQYREETERVLTAALDRTQSALDPLRRPAEGFAQDRELYTTIPAFCAVADWEGRVLLALSFNASVDEADVTRAVAEALAAGTDGGRLKGQNLRFRTERRGTWLAIAFADLGWERDNQRRLVISAALVWVLALAGFFAVSAALARWLVRPVEEGWKRQQQFVADASHELKTPLTVLLADADILLGHPGDTVASQRRWVEHIRDEGVRMKELVQDLLLLARGDAAGDVRPQGRADLSELCGDCVMSFEPVAFEAGLTLCSDLAPGVAVPGNVEELRRLCAILLDNACKYCGPGGTVTVTLAAGDKALLTVHNTGEPIPAEAQPHLFERFYRADAARTREQGGSGLGLAIAAAIVERHRGKISLRSSREEGTAFTVALPLGEKKTAPPV